MQSYRDSRANQRRGEPLWRGKDVAIVYAGMVVIAVVNAGVVKPQIPDPSFSMRLKKLEVMITAINNNSLRLGMSFFPDLGLRVFWSQHG